MGRSPFSPRPRVSTHVKRWEMPCHLLDDAFPRPRPSTPGCWVCVPCRSTPFWVIWGHANRPQITAPFIHLYDTRFALSPRVSAERAMPKTGSLTGACSLLLKMENDVQRYAK